MATEFLSAEVAAYLPRWVRAALREEFATTSATFVEPRHAAVLLLDIAGFTQTTERLAQHGPRGAEELSDLLNDCFASLIEVIDRHRGDVIAFAGDGLLVMWDCPKMVDACTLAAQCAVALREVMNDQTLSAPHTLSQRISVDFGEVHCCKFGGFNEQWCFAVIGAPFLRLGEAYRKAKVGDVVLCDAVSRTIAEGCEGEIVDGLFRLFRVTSPIKLVAPTTQPEAPSSELEALVPSVVVDHLRLGESRWLAEFRNITVLYVNLLDVGFESDFVKTIQRAVLEVQRCVARFEGLVCKVLMDDKGISIAVAFGLPPLAHEEDPLRGVEAGLALQRELSKASIRTSIGIASGKLFCGDSGHRSRREYCVLGPAINLAARLMELADGGLLCDAATAQAIGDHISFSVLPPQHIKGSTALLGAYRPIAIAGPPRRRYGGEIIGRENERQQLRDILGRQRGGLVIVQGEPGIGKSRLLADLAESAQTQGIRILQGFATAIDKSTPYFAWRGVLLQLLEVDPREQTIPVTERVRARLQGDEVLIGWLPLLGEIIPIAIEETELTRQITGSARAACLEELVVTFLTSQQPTLLIFEDLHWFDSASLNLLAGVVRRLPKALIFASRRFRNLSVKEESNRLDLSAAIQINLGAMSAEAMGELIRRRLRADELPAGLAAFVHSHAGGNPFYCEEFALALRDTGTVSVTRGLCSVQTDLLGATRKSLSASLEGVIVSRIDTLPTEEQLILKVGSAIGSTFTAEIMQNVYPRPVVRSDIETILDRMVEKEMLRVQKVGSVASFSFPHAISQEVTYNLLSFAQRAALHRDIARALENQHEGRLELFYAQLAQHWERAEEKTRAVRYLELAAEQALRGYANRDAIRYVETALRLAGGTEIALDEPRLSGWEVIVGDAHNELADYEEAVVHYARAMTLGRQHSAQRPVHRIVSVLKNVAIQARLRLISPHSTEFAAIDRQKYERIAHIRERLAERHFFLNESLAVLDETLMGLNLAERAGAVTETISGFSALGLGLGMSGLRGLAHFYRDRALRLAEKSGGLPVTARAHLLAAVLGYGLGEWKLTQRCAERALSLYRQLGDRSRMHAPLTILIFSAILRSDLEAADKLIAEFAEMISSESSDQAKAWHLSAQILSKLLRNNTDIDELRLLNEMARAKQVRADRLLCFGILASAYLQRQDMSSAIDAADRGLAVLREVGRVWGSYVYGVAGVTEVFVARAMESGPSIIRSDAKAKALSACKHAVRATRTSPVCHPQALLLKGRVAFMSGKNAVAHRNWRLAAQAAARLEMPREIGLALYEMGRTAEINDPRRPSKLMQAADIFEKIGARGDLAVTRRAMSA
jgi:class 3 adenylate cyclase/tetratricopeptide (TPR) repeat protein